MNIIASKLFVLGIFEFLTCMMLFVLHQWAPKCWNAVSRCLFNVFYTYGVATVLQIEYPWSNVRSFSAKRLCSKTSKFGNVNKVHTLFYRFSFLRIWNPKCCCLNNFMNSVSFTAPWFLVPPIVTNMIGWVFISCLSEWSFQTDLIVPRKFNCLPGFRKVMQI